MRVASGFSSLVVTGFLGLLGVAAASACSSKDATVSPTGDDAAAPASDASSLADGAQQDGATTGDTGLAADTGQGDGSASDAGPLTSVAFEAELAKINCQFQARCGFIAASEEAACEAAVDASATEPLPYANPVAVGDGRLAFSAAAAQSCLDLSKTKGCFDQGAPSAVCDTVYTGTVAAGNACKANGECAAGYCDRGTTIHDGCAGTCKPFTATNATCGTGHAACALTDYCDTATSKQCKPRVAKSGNCDPNNGPFCQTSLFCVGTTCEAQGGVLGDACASNLFGSSCKDTFSCDATGHCAQRQGAGGACLSFDACNDGLDCVGIVLDGTGAVTQQGTCSAYLDVGGACTSTLTETGCPGGTACDTGTNKCVKVGVAGADCNTGSLYCREGLYCDGTPGKCQPLISIGGACTAPASGSDVNCYPSTQCDATSKVCALVCK